MAFFVQTQTTKMVAEVVNVEIVAMMMTMAKMVRRVIAMAVVIVVVAVVKAEPRRVIRTSKPKPCEREYSTLPRPFVSRSATSVFHRSLQLFDPRWSSTAVAEAHNSCS